MKRRCLYSWVDYPDFERELKIIEVKVPDASHELSEQVAAFVQELRQAELYKKAGVSRDTGLDSCLGCLK